jgi:sugar-specific transcriptional regulator TrmB
MSPTSRSKEEGVQVLKDLGLTITQAKSYLALCRLGISTTKTISTASAIARQDIYRTLARLQEFGLVNKVITTPTMFEAVPLQNAIEILMERKAEKNRELQAKTQRLLRNFGKNNERTAPTVEGSQFVLIPQGRAYVLKGKKAINASQESVECVTSWKRFLQMMFNCGGDVMEALNRGVEFRVIVDKPEDRKPLPTIVEDVFKNPSCTVRCVLAFPRVFMACFDKKEVLIATSADGSFSESTMLWSNAPPLVMMTQDYFETMWIITMER